MTEHGTVRTHGTPPDREARPPGRRAILVLALVVMGALVVTYAGGDPAAESDRSAITAPDVDDPPLATVTSLALAPAPVADPLDRRVPGFEGTLVITMGTSAGTEVWRWSTGPDGVLARSTPSPDTYDARPEPTGSAVAAIHRHGRDQPALVLGSETPTTNVFLGAEGFAWHPVDAGAIVWIEEPSDSGASTIHLGRWVGDGVGFKPVGEIPALDAPAGGGGRSDRLVGFDDLGLVLEHADALRPTVTRVALDGTVLGSVSGAFAGSSGIGAIAVTAAVTVLHDGIELEPVRRLGAAYDSVVWSDDGRIAAASRSGSTVDLVDGFATRTVDVGAIGPSVLAWSADGRFVIASGSAGDEPVLVFVDSATLDVTVLLVTGFPVSVVSLR